MKLLGILCLLASLFLFIDIAREQSSGEVSTRGHGARTVYQASRNEDPDAYRNLMNYQWARAALVLGLGLAILSINREVSRWNIFSPDRPPGKAVKELEDYLNSRKKDP